MIELLQKEHYIVGSKDAVASLAKKDHARILVVSDSHNHPGILTDILHQFGPSCDAFVFCGDGLSDIAHIYSLAIEKDEIKQIIPPVMAFVSGNCDPSLYPLSLKNQLHAPSKQILTVNGQNIMIVHGNKESVDFGFEKLEYKMKLNNCKTALYGHTHIAMETYIGDYKFINPGSCATPRGSQPPSFAILTVEKTFIDTAFIKIDFSEDGKNSYKIWQPN